MRCSRLARRPFLPPPTRPAAPFERRAGRPGGGGRRRARMTVFACATVLGGAVAAPGARCRDRDGRGSATGSPSRASTAPTAPVADRQTQLPTMELPVDLLVGQQLWTTDGQRVDLDHDGDVAMIARCPTAGCTPTPARCGLLPDSASEPLCAVRPGGVDGEPRRQPGGHQRPGHAGGHQGDRRRPGHDRRVVSGARDRRAGDLLRRARRRSPARRASTTGAPGALAVHRDLERRLLAVFGSAGANVAVGIVRGKDELLCLVDVTAIKKG